MARTPVGNRRQPDSNAAVAAHVASRLAGVGSNRHRRDKWLREELQVRLGSNALDRAAPRVRAGIEPWVLVDEQALPLELEKALVVFPGEGALRPGLEKSLRQTGAVRQLLITRSRRDLVCILLFERRQRDPVFAALEATGERFLWEDVLFEDRRLELDAWFNIAQLTAEEDRLALQ